MQLAQLKRIHLTANRSLLRWLRSLVCDAIWRLERSQIKNQPRAVELQLGAERQDPLEADQLAANILTSHLRLAPYWINGHYDLGQRALRLGQSDLAYACAQAVIQLSPNDSKRGELLLARALRQAGHEQQSLRLLQKLQNEKFELFMVSEEIGIILSARGEYTQAVELLTSIPIRHRSPEVHTAILYLEGKIRVTQNGQD